MDQNYIYGNSEGSFEGKKPDNLCRAGCILSIVISSILLGFFVLCALLAFVMTTGYFAGFGAMAGIMYLIIGSVQIAPIILCTSVLKGKAESHIAAGIVSLLFSFLIGGILILVGKYEIDKSRPIIINQQQD
ncbi:MAG: hypothetical protein EIB84_06825 [Spiroplasma poulsonii]|uniref:Uncharacterized protein n=1 Tax=Spiroplasma poulsonii TaxID=2138 RepID=A0A2P6FCQ2_9MOLU|nr:MULTISPECIES: hypothetical protein [Spiroplasma]KAF0851632.1 hypothetical protein MSROBK_010790 [Spiroplasma poulsonii]MBH8623126.1 hypothetical protein [Spiroplasma sp. hyd1]MBW1242459.1 hypothetical protein [Spiroplasma poulsonii]PQM31230.1 hypothetical protein SMSRO_SF010450 [Spiroplasma poulsonii]PWF96233.1 hypothetical protein SMSE_16800 [Spiroplasma poulsonii]